MRNFLSYWRICFLIMFLFTNPVLQASPDEIMQDIKITGKVIDASKEGIPGANVAIKGTNLGTITDVDGNFTITVPNKKAILVISFIGYATQEVTVDNNQKITVILEDDSQALEEVVVVAYGTKTKATITGATSTMNNKDLTKAPPVASVTNVLAGAMPGVSAVQTTGKPGQDAADIYIRGCGSLNNSLAKPLVMVDGVERDFSQLDPNEIESISILKDASSTAVFGVRGANGVV